MRRLMQGQQVVVNNEGKIEVGKIKCLSKVQRKMIFYDVTLERGVEIPFVTTNGDEFRTFIDLNLTGKYFPPKAKLEDLCESN